jgi:hypothetical protein
MLRAPRGTAPVCGAAGAPSQAYTANALNAVFFDDADGSVSTFARQILP